MTDLAARIAEYQSVVAWFKSNELKTTLLAEYERHQRKLDSLKKSLLPDLLAERERLIAENEKLKNESLYIAFNYEESEKKLKAKLAEQDAEIERLRSEAMIAHELVRQSAAGNITFVETWQPIETINTSDSVLLYSPGDEETGYIPFMAVECDVNHHGEIDCPRDTRFEDGCHPTHWMSLPDPPHIPWRMQTGNNGDFDELVVGRNAVHLEMMDDRILWMAIYRQDGERWCFYVTMDKDGKPKRVTMTEEPHADL